MASNESLIMKHHWWHFNAAAAQLWTMTTQKIESDLTLSSVRGGGGHSSKRGSSVGDSELF